MDSEPSAQPAGQHFSLRLWTVPNVFFFLEGGAGAEGEESTALALHVLSAGGACQHQAEQHTALGAPGPAPMPSQPAGALRPQQSLTEHTTVFLQVPEAFEGGPEHTWSSECEKPQSYSIRGQSCCSNNPHYSGPSRSWVRTHHRISASALKVFRLGIFPAVPSTHHTERRADTGDNLPQKCQVGTQRPPTPSHGCQSEERTNSAYLTFSGLLSSSLWPRH